MKVNPQDKPELPELVSAYLSECLTHKCSLVDALNVQNVLSTFSQGKREWVRSWFSRTKQNQNDFATAFLLEEWTEPVKDTFVVPLDSAWVDSSRAYLARAETKGEYDIRPLQGDNARFFFSSKELQELPETYQKMAKLYTGRYAENTI